MRHGRSEQAGDLKAGNITLLLDWMTTSTRLTLPHGVRGLGLVWYILKPFNLFGGTCELETRLTAGVSQLDSVVFNLELLKFDTYVHELGVKVAVSMYLTGEAPVVIEKEVVVQELEVSAGTHHEVVEPRQNRKCRFCFAFFIVLVVGLHIQVDCEWGAARPVVAQIAGYCTIIIEFDPLSRA